MSVAQAPTTVPRRAGRRQRRAQRRPPRRRSRRRGSAAATDRAGGSCRADPAGTASRRSSGSSPSGDASSVITVCPALAPPTAQPPDRRRCCGTASWSAGAAWRPGAFVVASHAKFTGVGVRRPSSRPRPDPPLLPDPCRRRCPPRPPGPPLLPVPAGFPAPAAPLPVLPAFGPIAPVQPPPARISARYGQRARILPSTTPDPSQTVQGTSGIASAADDGASGRDNYEKPRRSPPETRYRRCVAKGPSLTDSFSSRMPSGSASNNRTPPPTR